MNLAVTFSYALLLFRLFKLKRQVVNGLPLNALRLVKLAYRFVSLSFPQASHAKTFGPFRSDVEHSTEKHPSVKCLGERTNIKRSIQY